MHAQRYTNPVVARPLPEACVVRTDDGFVAVGRGAVRSRVLEVLRSPDLVRWVSAGGALEPVAGAAAHRWPQLARHAGRWWLTVVVLDPARGPHVRVASAADPVGPFRDPVDVLPGLEAAVQEPFLLTGADGHHLFVCRDGAVDVVPMELPDRAAGPPVRAVGPDAVWRTVHRPCVVRRGGRFHLFHTGALRDGRPGGVGHAVAEDPAGPWRRPAPGTRVLRPAAEGVRVVGGPWVVAGPGGGDVLGYEAQVPPGTPARLCVDPLRWAPDGPVVDGPTWWETSLPR